MADRYWVGGSGSWTSTSRWSTTSGGASGASVPTASDNVIFDANSGTAHYTVTVTDNATCANLTFTPHASDGVTQFSVGVNFVIAGTFSTSGTQGNRRARFRSTNYSLMRDMEIANIGTVADVDFRDIRITGAGGTLTGTRIGNLGGNLGITFSTAKNCYRIGSGNWSEDQWAATSGGTPSTDFFPLAQDTAIIDENTGAGTHTLGASINYTGTVDMSARTSALTLQFSSAFSVYGDWTFGSGITTTSTSTLYFAGRNTQTITSAGVTFSCPLGVESYGGTVELADALNIGANQLIVITGTFDTKNYNFTCGGISGNYARVRAIKLGSSTVTLSGDISVGAAPTGFTFDAGTSTLVFTSSVPTIGGGLTYYDVSMTSTAVSTTAINQDNTFRNLSIAAPITSGLRTVNFGGNQTITGTLTITGATPSRRILAKSNVNGTVRTLTVGTLSADDCDFRDITIAGGAAGGSPTRAGDCGGNSGVNFPAPKTVYWNLAGSQSWVDGWATTSGGTPSVDNIPLAQDTAIFDDTGSAGTVTTQALNVGTVDMSARTTAMTLQGNPTYSIYGDWTFGSGVTPTGTATIVFSKRGTSTITSNGKVFSGGVSVDNWNGTVQLADAIELATTRTLTLTSGTLDAVTYNVTAGRFTGGGKATLKMGSGTWTMTSTGGTVWNMGAAGGDFNLEKGTADILFTDTSTGSRTFDGSGFYFNKFTIGGTTGTSTVTINGSGGFTELASTKTVAHTINFGSTTQSIGKWSISGSLGNVVTLSGTGTSHILAGSCTDGIDYLAMGSIGFSTASPGEFYAGPNSTGTAGAPVYFTSKPADSTRYWVGGTGNWSDTSHWSTSSGGAGGADVPRSHDNVVFDSNSNATSYSVTVDAVTGGNRCKALTFAGPASGTVTWAGSTTLFIHDNITLPATGLARNYTGTIGLSGSTSGKTITTNGVSLASSFITLNGVGSEWSLGDALNMGNRSFSLYQGSFNTAGYNWTVGNIACGDVTSGRSLSLGSSNITCQGSTSISFNTTARFLGNLTFDAGTSQLNITVTSANIVGNGQTFYDVTLSGTGFHSIVGSNTFNNLTVVGRTAAGVTTLNLDRDQTINGTLTLSAGSNSTCRTFVRSSSVGTTRTLTCAAVASLTDIDFRDIAIAGAAVSGGSLTGTRLGDCKNNTNITFDAGKTVYWVLSANANWGNTTAWSTTSGGAASADNFPLAQDTAIIEASSPPSAATLTIDANYNIGTIDLSARTTNTVTLVSGNSPFIYGNFIMGSGVVPNSSGTFHFGGRGNQTITSAGVTFGHSFSIDSPGGSVTLQDALETTRSSGTAIALVNGTLDANNYNITCSLGGFNSSNSNTRTVAVGSGTWTFGASSTVWNTSSATNLTVTGSGTLRFTSGSTKNFSGGDADFSTVTIDQGGAGTLGILGNNRIGNVTNSYRAVGATTITFNTFISSFGAFSAKGAAGNVLTVQGSNANSPAILIFDGVGTAANVDYLVLRSIHAYPLADTWYAGDNSSNEGSLGWLFTADPNVVTSTGNFFLFF